MRLTEFTFPFSGRNRDSMQVLATGLIAFGGGYADLRLGRFAGRSGYRQHDPAHRRLSRAAADLLRRAGWDCDTVHGQGLAGADDAQVASACQSGARVLFTLVLDFADIRAYAPSDYVGIVVLRPAAPSRRQVLDLVARVLSVFAAEWIEHRLWIVEPARVRIRETDEPAL